MYKLQPIRQSWAGLRRHEGGSRAAADTEGEEAEHASEEGRGGKVEVGRHRDAVPQRVCCCNSPSSRQGSLCVMELQCPDLLEEQGMQIKAAHLELEPISTTLDLGDYNAH